MTLTTEDLGDVPDIAAATLDEVFIQAGNDWQPSEECAAFLQRHDSDPWVLEHREAGRQFRATKSVTLQQVRQAFQSFLAGASDWRSEFAWVELEL